MNHNITGVLLIIAVLILGLFVGSCMINSEQKEIAQWVQSKGEKVVSIEYRALHIGPYFYIKNARYYRVQTNTNVYWVKYVFGRTIKKEVGTGYQDVE